MPSHGTILIDIFHMNNFLKCRYRNVFLAYVIYAYGYPDLYEENNIISKRIYLPETSKIPAHK